MKKVISYSILITILGTIGYGIWDYHRAGFFDLPEGIERSDVMSFTSGARLIVRDLEIDRNLRKYGAIPFDVPHYLVDAWIPCVAATSEEKEEFEEKTKEGEVFENFVGYRLEGLCFATVDEKKILRAALASRPLKIN